MRRTLVWVLASLLGAFVARSSSARGAAMDDALLAAGCLSDVRLAPVAAEVLAHHDPIDGEALRALAEAHAIAAPNVRAWVGEGSEPGVLALSTTWLAHQSIHRGWAHCAWRQQAGTWAMVLVPRVATVHPADGAVHLGDRIDVDVELPTDASDATVMVTFADGRTARVAPGQRSVRVTSPGTLSLQVVANTPMGPLPFARWHVDVDGAAPVAPATDEAPEVRPLDDARQLRTAINQVRHDLGIAPLRADPLLDALAQERAHQLAARGAVAHALEADDSPVARLARAHLAADRLAENVARAHTLRAAHARLEASPSHHANRVDPALDAVGIGVATVGDTVYLVELYAAGPRIAP